MVGQGAPHLVIRHLLAEAGAGQLGGQLGGGGRAEIGLDQQLLQLLQRRIVQLALGEDAADAFGQLGGGARQPLLQSGEPPSFRRPCAAVIRLFCHGRFLTRRM
jgi:hypothetical protein